MPFTALFLSCFLLQSKNQCSCEFILKAVFTSDGVVVGIIRSVERYDLVKIKPTETEAERDLVKTKLSESETESEEPNHKTGNRKKWKRSDSSDSDSVEIPWVIRVLTTTPSLVKTRLYMTMCFSRTFIFMQI